MYWPEIAEYLAKRFAMASTFLRVTLEKIKVSSANKKCEGTISSEEVGIREENSNFVLPCGIYARWEKNE